MKIKLSNIVSITILLLFLIFIVVFDKEIESALREYFDKSSFISSIPLYTYLLEHIKIVFFSSILSIFIGFTIGLFITTKGGEILKEPILDIIKIGQAFPSVAILALLIPFIGYGITGVVIALIMYSLMPIIYNTYIGINNIDKDVIEGAMGMGLNEWQLYYLVKLPLAATIIISGIRTAVVVNISAVTLAAAVGAGGLGVLIVNGVRTFDTVMILRGAVPVALLALICEILFIEIENRFFVNK
ncbi:MAG: ABC transporter permease [Fusobacteria bacterium]|nr:ABC transporter permease [Fusobacteriota bacterium]